MKKISRRSFVKAAGTAIALTALTACGGSASSSVAASTASSAASGSAAASSEAVSADVQAIIDRGVLKVGVKNAVKGFSFQDTLTGEGFNADTFNADTWKDGISFRQYDDYPAISTALSAGEVNGFCVDKSILAIYKTEGRSYIDAEFSPQEYGVATKKGSGFSALCDELVSGWLSDGTIDGLIKENGLE